jgi:predicted DNA-binding transcriptional regulator
MSTDKQIGIAIFAASIAGILVYGWLVFFGAPMIVLQLTAFVAISLILGILAWIGYTMATTPPPEPISETLDDTLQEKNEKEQSKETNK